MREIEKLLVLFSMCEIPNKKQELIIKLLGDKSIEQALNDKVVFENLSTEEYQKLLKSYNKQTFESMLTNMKNSEIEIVSVFSDRYPKSLFDLDDRPLILYAKGDLTLCEKKCIAIVGTRVPSNYGRIITEKFAKNLAQSGVVIVSGLCYGVDAIAHKATLDVGGKTIAVIGSGFNNIYPASNTNLAGEIAEKGLILSEYPPSFTAKRYTFPRRNRIVAGLSDGVLITEAGLKSGTVHTKDFALDYGKDVFAVPGNIISKTSELTNYLIKYGHAECALSPDDIIEFYGLNKVQQEKKVENVSLDEQTIMSLLADGEQDFDFLHE
ncbi:MAG: DNA-processing protein DprA, partial [Clostridia bacterium]|nr:DNA-processing protein DprA [Clostridia bacterium]